MVYNPSLRQQPRSQRAALIPPRQESSILDWLENSGRLLAREPQDKDFAEDEEEINALMATDDGAFDLEEDDDLELDEE